MVSNGIDSVADDGWPPDTPPADSGPHDGPNFPPPKLPLPRPFPPNTSLAVTVDKNGNASLLKGMFDVHSVVFETDHAVIPEQIKVPETEDFSKYTKDEREVVFLMIRQLQFRAYTIAALSAACRDKLKAMPNMPADSIDELFNVDGLKSVFDTAQKMIAPILFPPDSPALAVSSEIRADQKASSGQPSTT